MFVNTYATAEAKVKLTATKEAIGAPLVCGQFTFGLYDKNGNLVSNTTNSSGRE